MNKDYVYNKKYKRYVVNKTKWIFYNNKQN